MTNKIVQQIQVLSIIKLDSDPVSAGLSSINEKIAEIANKRSKITRITNNVISLKQKKELALDTAKSLYKVRLDSLIVNDDEVKSGKSKEERNTIAKSKLLENQQIIDKLKNDVNKINSIFECCKNCSKTLDVAKESISRQLSVINKQIEIGEIDARSFSKT